jgi:hypothetical protein
MSIERCFEDRCQPIATAEEFAREVQRVTQAYSEMCSYLNARRAVQSDDGMVAACECGHALVYLGPEARYLPMELSPVKNNHFEETLISLTHHLFNSLIKFAELKKSETRVAGANRDLLTFGRIVKKLTAVPAVAVQ